jgi:hypothetical protein
MHYVNYEEAIVQRYGIELIGWTYDKFVNPSELSTAIEPLRKLLDAINNGHCKFVKLTKEERQKRLETYRAKIATGELKAQGRKTCCDAGVKRKGKAKKTVTNDGSSSDDEEDLSDDTDEVSDQESRHKQRATIKRRRVSNSESE